MCVLTAGIKRYKSIIKRKKKKHDEIVLLAKLMLNTTEVLISKALIDLYVNHDEFVLVKNMLREYNEKKEEIKTLETSVDYINMVDISRETIVDSDGILRLNEKHIEEGLNHKNKFKTKSCFKFKTRLGFKKYDAILTREQSVLTKFKSSFEEGNMQTQYSVLGYRTDSYFHDHKLAL